MEMKGLSRRDFLKGTLAGTLGISTIGVLGGCSPSETDSSKTDTPNNTQEFNKASWRTPPEPITEFVKNITTDVLVVGAGNAGLFAACAAAEKGAKVLVIERNAMVGIGREWIGAIGTRLQKEAGININKFEVIHELASYASNRVDQELLKLWADYSGQTVDWLENVVKEYGAYMILETDTGGPSAFKTFPIQHNIQNDEKTIKSTLILEKKQRTLG